MYNSNIQYQTVQTFLYKFYSSYVLAVKFRNKIIQSNIHFPTFAMECPSFLRRIFRGFSRLDGIHPRFK